MLERGDVNAILTNREDVIYYDYLSTKRKNAVESDV